MNIRIKRAMLAAGIAMALPLSGQASDGTITFTGAVTASTCTLSVNGGGSGTATVALPTVDIGALSSVGAGTTAAGTFFSVGVTNCTGVADIGSPTPAAPTSVAIYFEAGPNVDEVTGGLINTLTSGSNVEVNLYNASGSTIVGTQIQPGTPTHQPTALTIASGGTQWFYAGYATVAAAAATAGAVSTSITYSLVYN